MFVFRMDNQNFEEGADQQELIVVSPDISDALSTYVSFYNREPQQISNMSGIIPVIVWPNSTPEDSDPIS